MAVKERKIGKKKWIDMGITRVRLNPEQAVLACCCLPTKMVVGGGNYQCGSGGNHTVICPGASWGGYTKT